MKKSLLMLIMAVAFMTAGCAKEDAKEDAKVTQSALPTADAQQENASNDDSQQENASTEQNASEGVDLSKVDAYMTSVKTQSDSINTSLEQEELTQQEMNTKSDELYKLWDDAVTYLIGELQKSLSEDNFSKLQDEQNNWVTTRDNAMKEAGKEFEGGSMYALVVNGEGATLTEKRADELYQMLKK